MSYIDFVNLETIKKGNVNKNWLKTVALSGANAQEYNTWDYEEILAKFLAKTVIGGTIFSLSIPDTREIETKIDGFDAIMTIKDKLIREKELLDSLDIHIFTNLHKSPIVYNKNSLNDNKLLGDTQVQCKLKDAMCDVCYEDSTEKEILYICPHCKGKFCLKCVLDSMYLNPENLNFMCLGCQEELSLARLFYIVDQSHPSII